MAGIYIKADEMVHSLANLAVKNWYPDLQKVKLQIGILFVLSARESQPALKENGHPVEGTIKIVPLKDRVTKGFDVEILIDGDEWKTHHDEHKIALLDHLLCRLEVKKPKKKKKKKNQATTHGTDEEREEHEEAEFITDDIGRPALKLKKGDWNAGFGFSEVVERHGNYSLEARNIDKARYTVDSALKIYKEDQEHDRETDSVTARLAASAEQVEQQVQQLEDAKKVSPETMATSVTV